MIFSLSFLWFLFQYLAVYIFVIFLSTLICFLSIFSFSLILFFFICVSYFCPKHYFFFSFFLLPFKLFSFEYLFPLRYLKMLVKNNSFFLSVNASIFVCLNFLSLSLGFYRSRLRAQVMDHFDNLADWFRFVHFVFLDYILAA